MAQLDDALDVIDGIYDAGIDPGQWQSVMSQMSGFLTTHACYALVVDKTNQSVPISALHEMDPDCTREYEEHYATICPRINYTIQNPDVEIFADYHHIDESNIDKNEFYADYLARYDLRYYLAAKVLETDKTSAFFAFQRSAKEGHVQDVEMERCQLLFPHLRRAVELNQRLSGVDLQLASAEETLDRLTTGIVMVDFNGNVLFKNKLASVILSSKDGLSIRGRKLVAEAPGQQQKLQGLLGSAISTSDGRLTQPGGSMPVFKPSGRRAYTLDISPLGRREIMFAREPLAMAVIFITDPDLQSVRSPDDLASVYGLTAAEAKLTFALSSGSTLNEYADEADVTIETARWHLKNTLGKTGVHSQGELIRLVESPTVAAPSPGKSPQPSE